MADDASRPFYWKIGLLAYLLAVAASLLVQEVAPIASEQLSSLPASWVDVAFDTSPGAARSTVRISYQDVGTLASSAEANLGKPVIVLPSVHHAADDRETQQVVAHLSTNHRVLVPRWQDLVADKDSNGHSVGSGLSAWMDSLGIGAAHLVGLGFGGEAAIHLHRTRPRAVASLTLNRARGVQELELLGQHALNRGLYVMQGTLLDVLHVAVPHFGAWTHVDRWREQVHLAQQLDLRSLRTAWSAIHVPVLLTYRHDDLRIRPTVAREIHRLLPQSQIAWVSGTKQHRGESAEALGPLVGDFLGDVEEGRVPTYDEAEPVRVEAAQRPYDRGAFPPMGGTYLIIFMTLLALATFVSEDLTCIAAGLLVAQESMAFLPAVTACFLGIFVGDMLLYAAGRWVGRPVVQMRPISWFVSAADLERGKRWLQTKGTRVIILSRFVPGSRLPTYVAAGVLGAHAGWFALVLAGAAAVWTPILVGAAVLLGQQVLHVVPLFEAYALPVLLAAAFMLLFTIRILVPLLTHKGRRLAYGRWCRLSRWEFWPPFIVYPPLFWYVGVLMIRYRGVTVCTAANPGIPHGGFAGESKASILDGLAGAGEAVARWELIGVDRSVEDRVAQICSFQKRNRLSWPLVLKPDTGERGQGVRIVHAESEVRDAVREAPQPLIAQEYVAGREYGVFYYRFPGEARGRILSITDKRFPVLVGDGVSTLEELILADRRAVCMAPIHLKNQMRDLDRVLGKGERFKLVQLGTHARGAVFLDGTYLQTPELEQAIDAISRTFEGFFFGRYDIRVPSEEALKRGEGIRVLELNGVTSESTNIYDPAHSLWFAYRTLARQWRLAFAIGAANRERGVAPSRLRDVVRSTWHHLKST